MEADAETQSAELRVDGGFLCQQFINADSIRPFRFQNYSSKTLETTALEQLYLLF